MRQSKLDQLKQLTKRTVAERELKNAVLNGKAEIRTGYYTGSGKHTKANDVTESVSQILKQLGIKHETGNDAPRGGVSGQFVKITDNYMKKVIRKDKRERDNAKLLESFGTTDKEEIERIKEERQKEGERQREINWNNAVSWVKANRERIKAWWDKRAHRLNGSWGSTQCARRLAFEFAEQSPVGMSTLKHAIKKFA